MGDVKKSEKQKEERTPKRKLNRPANKKERKVGGRGRKRRNTSERLMERRWRWRMEVE